jgi:hypothetical protein
MNIDRIAREMVDVEPSAGLEARIRARLDEARPARTTAWWTWRVAMPVGAIATAALAIAFVVRGPGLEVQSTDAAVQSLPADTAVQSSPRRSLGEGGPAEAQIANAGSPLRQVRRVAVRSAAPSQLSAEEVAWMERRIPALDAVNGLQVDQLRVDSIQPEPLAITPLTMPPVSTEGAGSERRIER